MNTSFKAKLDECYEALSEGRDIKSIDLRQIIRSTQELTTCLPAIKEEHDIISKGISDCKTRIKTWQEAKKAWEERQSLLMKLVEESLTGLNLKNITDGKIKASMTTRTVLEVTAEEVLKPYKSLVDSLSTNLPPFIKVSLDIDKTALGAYLKSDDTLLLTMPESIHYKDSRSVKIS